MNITKKQHYIPIAAHFKHFANKLYSDPRENEIIVYGKENSQIRTSKLNDCGFQKNLYEYPDFAPNALENLFSEMEKDFESFLDKIVDITMNPENKNALILHGQVEKANIKFYATTLFLRASKRLKQHELNNIDKTTAKGQFLFDIIGVGKDGKYGIQHYMDILLPNHFPVFSINETNSPLVLSDDAVIFINSNENSSIRNLVFPLTPWLLIYLFDPKGENGIAHKQSKNRITKITEKKVIQEVNRLSLENASREIYCLPNQNVCFNEKSKDFLLVP